MDELLKIYITSIKLMLPMALMNLMLLGIVVGQNAPVNAVNFLKNHSCIRINKILLTIKSKNIKTEMDFAGFFVAKYNLLYNLFTGKRIEELCPGLYVDWNKPKDFDETSRKRRNSLKHATHNHVLQEGSDVYIFDQSETNF